VNAIYTYGTSQPSLIDRNFRGTQEFTLPLEENRPVYVPLTAVVPSSGAIAVASSRRYAQYGSVVSTTSDFHNHAFDVSVSSAIPLPLFFLAVNYGYRTTQTQNRGFDGLTTGDPLAILTSRSLDQHMLAVSHQWLFGRRASLIVGAQWSSGIRYTPRVSNDINGDGRANDVAFVFDPASAPPDVADAMSALLTNGPHAVRSCLGHQRGHIARIGSCKGPWSTAVLARLDFFLKWLPSGGLTINFINLGGALDQLLHGSNHLHGWGEPAYADPVLLFVDGFDPASRQFHYRVNPRFGQRGSSRLVRNPFQIQVSFSSTIGPSLETQQNRNTARSVRATEGNPNAVRRGLMITDQFAKVLELRENLQLTPEQVVAIQRLQTQWLRVSDSTAAALAQYIEEMADSESDRAVAEHLRAVEEALGTVDHQNGRDMQSVITEDQLGRLPRYLRLWITQACGDAMMISPDDPSC
jgi:hypothetical protein